MELNLNIITEEYPSGEWGAYLRCILPKEMRQPTEITTENEPSVEIYVRAKTEADAVILAMDEFQNGITEEGEEEAPTCNKDCEGCECGGDKD